MNLNLSIEDKKKLGVIAFAVGLGLVAVVLLQVYLKKSEESKSVEIFKKFDSTRVKPLKDEIQALQQELGAALAQQQAALAEIQKNIAKTKTEPAARGNLAKQPPPGKRAMTIMMEKLAALDGLVKPGDFVDIIVHLKAPSSGQSNVTATVFQNIQVLDVGGSSSARAAGAATPAPRTRSRGSIPVTFALSPEEAALLSFTQKNGSIQLALRSEEEPATTKQINVADWNSLKDYVKETAGADLDLSPASSGSIQVIRGGQVQ